MMRVISAFGEMVATWAGGGCYSCCNLDNCPYNSVLFGVVIFHDPCKKWGIGISRKSDFPRWWFQIQYSLFSILSLGNDPI